LALQEAMACGCAVVGSRIGGIPELIAEETLGLLVEAGHVSELAAALEKLIANADLREKLGRAAARSIRERGMTVETMVQRQLELYETVLQKS
jgi:glycosyltransferase involved in cell wall biosynthesis